MNARTFVVHKLAAYTCVNIGECTMILVGRIQGIAPGGRPPLFSDQSEARRAEKDLFWDRPLRFWMTASPLSPKTSIQLHLSVFYRLITQTELIPQSYLSREIKKCKTDSEYVGGAWRDRQHKEQLWGRLEYVLIF